VKLFPEGSVALVKKKQKHRKFLCEEASFKLVVSSVRSNDETQKERYLKVCY
jgi:hypothetical protein